MIIALIFEILVLVLILRFTLKQKTGEPFSKKSMRRFIIFGLLTGVILVVLMLITPVENDYFFDKMHPVAAGFVTAFLLAALPEEIVKYVMFCLAVRKNDEIKVVHDVIIVSVIIAFGFSLLEDIQYTVFDGSGAALRALVPAHMLFQIVMGYFYGRAKAENKSVFHVLSLVMPVIMHTVFDMFIISLMACIGGNDVTGLTEDTLMNLPYFDLLIPLIVCVVIVALAAAIGTIAAFAGIKRKRESAVMQEILN